MLGVHTGVWVFAAGGDEVGRQDLQLYYGYHPPPRSLPHNNPLPVMKKKIEYLHKQTLRTTGGVVTHTPIKGCNTRVIKKMKKQHN